VTGLLTGSCCVYILFEFFVKTLAGSGLGPDPHDFLRGDVYLKLMAQKTVWFKVKP